MHGATKKMLIMQFGAAFCLFSDSGAGARRSPMFGPNVTATRGLVPVTRLSPYLVALFQVGVINRCAVYVASVHLGARAYLQTMLVRRPKARSHVGRLGLDWKTLLQFDAEETEYGGVYWVHMNENGY
jgi:hypothetical protein